MVSKSKDRKKLIEELWKIRREGEFVDYKQEDIFSKKELNILKAQNV